MTQGFQQQQPDTSFCIPKSAPSQQNGQKAAKAKAEPLRPLRSFEPRPGH